MNALGKIEEAINLFYGRDERYIQLLLEIRKELTEQLPTVIKRYDFVYYLSKPVWFESHGYYMGRKAFWCFPLAIENGLYVKLIAAHTGTDTILPLSNYGKAWRCWDKEPSDERSLGVKWK